MLDHILMNNTTIDMVPQPPSALALNQLSEDDRRLVARLKDTYPSHILESVFGDALKASERMGRREYHSPRESTGSSTLYLGTTSIDGETYCSSSASRSSYGSQDQSLYKRRAMSQSRSGSKSRIRGNLPRTSSVSSMTEPKEIRITITKPQSAPISSIPSIELKTLYFCTHCQKSFQEKDEWAEHENETHERQYYYSCQEEKCDKVFTQESLFTQHHKDDHSCTDCEHAVEIRRPLPSKRSWGCGFDRCSGFFNDWQTRCDHVANHFEDLAKEDDTSSQPSEWKYTNMIRNLLRQPDVKEAYRKTMTKNHGDDKLLWPKMRWQTENTVELRRRLEYRDFRGGVKELTQMAYQLGTSATTEEVKIVVEPVVSKTPAQSPPPASPALQNRNFLHIDKFPVPGQNPFDIYGPVPPSPIIQLDFHTEPEPVSETQLEVQPEPRVTHVHSSKSSISVPYSLYPSPIISERETIAPFSIHHTHSKSMSVTSPTYGLHNVPEGPPSSTTMTTTSSIVSPNASFTDSREFPARTTSKNWASTPTTDYPTSGTPVQSGTTSPSSPSSPSRPKTPKSIIRSAKGMMRKKPSSHMGSLQISLPISEPFDPTQMTQNIGYFHAR